MNSAVSAINVVEVDTRITTGFTCWGIEGAAETILLLIKFRL